MSTSKLCGLLCRACKAKGTGWSRRQDGGGHGWTACQEKHVVHFSIVVGAAGSGHCRSPRTEILPKIAGKVKHVLHVSHLRHIPAGNVLIKECCPIHHISHICYFGHVPACIMRATYQWVVVSESERASERCMTSQSKCLVAMLSLPTCNVHIEL